MLLARNPPDSIVISYRLAGSEGKLKIPRSLVVEVRDEFVES
jgi:hypothetical protein